MLEEFLVSELEAGRISSDEFTNEKRVVHVHGHCHQKALSDPQLALRALGLPVNYEVHLIPSGCCGMAGSFGYEKEHYEVSMDVGRLVLFPYIDAQESKVLFSANGTSCRHQILDGTGREAEHPATILRKALRKR